MRVLIVAAITERINLPTLPLGAALVAAATEAHGHEVGFLDLMGEPDPEGALRQTIERVRPDAIGVSVRNIDDQAMTRPTFLLDKELAAAMADAGYRAASLGFEAGDDRMLRAYGKHFDTADVRRIAGLLADHGIRRFGFLLLGGPGETSETFANSLDFVESLDLDLLKVTVGVRIYPGAGLARTALDERVVAADDDLLRPRFYMTPNLQAWIRDELVRRGLGARG